MIAMRLSPSQEQQFRNRRNFLRFLAASPLLASLSARASQTHTLDEVLASPKDALDVMDFEGAARKARRPRTGATWLQRTSASDYCRASWWT
jgi:hypothetical protein